ncbi:heavy metal-associated domain-containing protein [Alisedimentitalea sp. MJ-SS2]|uniref:heavy-metal-associated domain-containing protein n=1 Tax=Aliisedimentitalea sp. MJ-SS2 TaxID=3049795 RepID=UPI00290658F7|nr:heavy metal-associated domain-containing protein [Alisedimentitalea sp. MJ-SS2]MDU8927138.1 heavy metal-associated domain-containing protein [Alisedimentitalea sp. MJ-SS2]
MAKYSVPKMSCGHCTASIEDKVLDADEGAEIQFDLETRTVVIESVLDEAGELAAIKEAGFEASAV